MDLFPEIAAFKSNDSLTERTPAYVIGGVAPSSQKTQFITSLEERPLRRQEHPNHHHQHFEAPSQHEGRQNINGAAQSSIHQLESNRLDGNRSFRDVVANNSIHQTTNTARVSPPCRFRPTTIGGNVAVRIDGDVYRGGLAKFDNCLIGRLVLFKGNLPLDTITLKAKLSSLWRLPVINWKIIPLGRGFFCLDMKNPAAKSMVFARGTLSLNPGMFYISKWVPNFNPNTQKMTNTQVWIRIHNLSMDYWKEEFLLDIGMGVGTALRVDRITLEQELGHFARVLVDIDVSRDLPDRILVQIDDFEFFVQIEFENLPDFCQLCNGIGHGLRDCRLYKARNDGVLPVAPRADTRPAQSPVPTAPAITGNADAATGIPVPQVSQTGGPVNFEEDQGEANPAQTDGSGSEKSRNADVSEHASAAVLENVKGMEIPTRAEENGTSHVSDSLPVAVSLGNDVQNMPESAPVGAAAHNTPVLATLAPDHNTHATTAASDAGSQCPNALMSLPFHSEECLLNNNAKTPSPYHPYKQPGSWADFMMENEAEDSPSPTPGNVLHGGPSTVRPSSYATPSSLGRGSLKASSSTNSHVWRLKTGGNEIETQLNNMNSDVIYWVEDEGIYIHASGMCYDPVMAAFFKRIDPTKGDLRSIYYTRRSGDFSPARNGELGKSNKIIFDDDSWDRLAIYSVKTPYYRTGLPKLF